MPGIYEVTVRTPSGDIRVMRIQAKNAEDASKKVLMGEVLNVARVGGSR